MHCTSYVFAATTALAFGFGLVSTGRDARAEGGVRGPAALPELTAQDQATIEFTSGQPVIAQADGSRVPAEVVENISADRLGALLNPLNMKADDVTYLQRKMAGKTVFVSPDGTFFIGTRQDIEAGKYYSAGRNSFFAGRRDLGYFAIYNNGALTSVHLSDGRSIHMESGEYHSVTETSTLNPKRVAVSLYRVGRLTGTKVIFKDLGGVELTYDASGFLTEQTLRSIQSGRSSGYAFEFIGQRGFRITAGDRSEEFKFNGHRLIRSNDEKDGQPGRRAVLDPKDFDVKQSLTLKIAGRQRWHALKIHDFLAKKSVSGVLDGAGGLNMRTIQTNIFGDAQSVVQTEEPTESPKK